jgi:hypothetical protein
VVVMKRRQFFNALSRCGGGLYYLSLSRYAEAQYNMGAFIRTPPQGGGSSPTYGGLWSFGYNNNGQLGLGDTADRSSPVQVGSLSSWVQLSCGAYHTTALKSG